ncbi:MAG: hypothetical protein WBF83_06630 [Moheibacter sp.]
MGTADLKLKIELIQLICRIEEGQIIRELKNHFDFELSNAVFELSQDQKNRLEEAREEYKNEKFFHQMK